VQKIVNAAIPKRLSSSGPVAAITAAIQGVAISPSAGLTVRTWAAVPASSVCSGAAGGGAPQRRPLAQIEQLQAIRDRLLDRHRASLMHLFVQHPALLASADAVVALVLQDFPAANPEQGVLPPATAKALEALLQQVRAVAPRTGRWRSTRSRARSPATSASRPRRCWSAAALPGHGPVKAAAPPQAGWTRGRYGGRPPPPSWWTSATVQRSLAARPFLVASGHRALEHPGPTARSTALCASDARPLPAPRHRASPPGGEPRALRRGGRGVKLTEGLTTDEGIRLRVEGHLVPIVELGLDAQHAIYFEHHTILAKSPQLNVGIMAVRGALRRMLAGLPILLTKASGPGNVSLSRDGVGEIIALDLHGEEVDVLEHRFLAASASVEYGAQRVRGFKNLLGSGTGFFMDRFRGNGLLLLHGYGDVMEVQLQAGEALDLDPYAWLYKDTSVRMDTHLVSLATGLFGASGFVMSRFTGPGRLAYQSMDPLAPLEATAE